jgi:hypothetical protein
MNANLAIAAQPQPHRFARRAADLQIMIQSARARIVPGYEQSEDREVWTEGQRAANKLAALKLELAQAQGAYK